MSPENSDLTAEQLFREAFQRLKDGTPKVLKGGTPVSQNNVAKEAGRDPSALRKSRYPSLVREIQAYVQIHGQERPSKRKELLKKRKARASLQARVAEVEAQRDAAQSQLGSAIRRIVELTSERNALREQLDALRPSPSKMRNQGAS